MIPRLKYNNDGVFNEENEVQEEEPDIVFDPVDAGAVVVVVDSREAAPPATTAALAAVIVETPPVSSFLLPMTAVSLPSEEEPDETTAGLEQRLQFTIVGRPSRWHHGGLHRSQREHPRPRLGC